MEKIFRHEDTVITEYENADFKHKINMYLNFRELRKDFFKIDQEIRFAPANSKS